MGIAVNRKRIGIIGGSFDPIHKGHLETAEFVYQQLGLEKIIFIPAYIAPHKIGMEYALAEHRYQMTLLAIQDNPHFCVSDIELKRKGVSYTYDTIAALHEYYGYGYEVYFIIGADSVAELDTWIKVRAPEVKKVIEYFGELGRTKIKWLNTPEMDISSTDIRQRVQDNCSITGLVPAQVEEYIHQKGLYRS